MIPGKEKGNNRHRSQSTHQDTPGYCAMPQPGDSELCPVPSMYIFVMYAVLDIGSNENKPEPEPEPELRHPRHQRSPGKEKRGIEARQAQDGLHSGKVQKVEITNNHIL